MCRPEASRRPDARRRSHDRAWPLGSALLGIAMVAVHDSAGPMVVYNVTASAPLGWYLVRPPAELIRGDLVLARTPDSARDLAEHRGYLPANVPLVKRVTALPPDRVCAEGSAIVLNGRVVAKQLMTDSRGRALPRWAGCSALAPDDVFLLMEDVPDSFDSRYFGPVKEGSILGRLVPLWTW